MTENSARQAYQSKAFNYIQGTDDFNLYRSCQSSVGDIAGCFKAWVPCLGCFCCCCNEPYEVIEQGNKGLLLRYGRYTQTLNPGLAYLNSLTDSLIKVDCRVQVIDIPPQKLITRDNISLQVDACAYYRINEPHLAYFRLQNVQETVKKVSGGNIKNTVSQFTFQDILQKRQQISEDIQSQIGAVISHWGVCIDQIYFKDFSISSQVQNQLVSAAVARRQAQSKILNAKGEVQVARMLSEKSKLLDSPTAFQVRALDTLKVLGSGSSNDMVYFTKF